ncbi:hypothetical protein [Pontibacillus yanchengensis]|uniref:hypothetical protein n=1 Tax=Pontibacillus yanchengensis TaxID=462910 RepID=UPI000ADA5EA2|nr:hypothetical protein [Pontibacillus yanchengensis]
MSGTSGKSAASPLFTEQHRTNLRFLVGSPIVTKETLGLFFYSFTEKLEEFG